MFRTRLICAVWLLMYFTLVGCGTGSKPGPPSAKDGAQDPPISQPATDRKTQTSDIPADSPTHDHAEVSVGSFPLSGYPCPEGVEGAVAEVTGYEVEISAVQTDNQVLNECVLYGPPGTHGFDGDDAVTIRINRSNLESVADEVPVLLTLARRRQSQDSTGLLEPSEDAALVGGVEGFVATVLPPEDNSLLAEAQLQFQADLLHWWTISLVEYGPSSDQETVATDLVSIVNKLLASRAPRSTEEPSAMEDLNEPTAEALSAWHALGGLPSDATGCPYLTAADLQGNLNGAEVGQDGNNDSNHLCTIVTSKGKIEAGLFAPSSSMFVDGKSQSRFAKERDTFAVSSDILADDGALVVLTDTPDLVDDVRKIRAAILRNLSQDPARLDALKSQYD